MRGAVMSDADVVLTVGRRLDFQLAYGSPAVFRAAQFVRIADTPSEMRDNRRGASKYSPRPPRPCAPSSNRPETANPRLTGNGPRSCVADMKSAPKNCGIACECAKGSDGKLHPNKVLAAIQQAIGDDSVVIADGGDFLAFAASVERRAYLDPGPRLPRHRRAVGIAASLALPDRQVVVATGDGAFGFNAIEVDTAVRQRRRC